VNEENGSGMTMQGRLAKSVFQLLIIALFVVAIIYFMRRYSADISSLRNLSWQSIAVIGAWSFVSYTTYAYAVYVVFIDLGLKNLGPIGWIKIYFVSRLVNLFVIQGGNLYRLIVLKKKYGFSYTNSIGVIAFLIWINALVALLSSVVALGTFERSFILYGFSLYTWCVLLVVAAASVPLFAVLAARMLRASSLESSRLVQPILSIAEFFIETVRKYSFFAKIAALSAAHFCFFVGVNYFTFSAIGQTLDLAVVCIFTTAFVFTRYINIVPGNLGVSELVGGLISEQMGVGFGNGLVVAGIVRMVEVLMIVLAGMIYGKFAVFEYFSNR